MILNKANSPKSDGIKVDNITVSLVHEGKPVKLIKWFKDNGCKILEKYPGIYYVSGNKILFPLQLIVSSRLSEKSHYWLKSLTSKMNLETGKCLVLSANSLSDKDDKENADSVIRLALAENPDIFRHFKEVPDMYEALMTLMKPEFDEALSKSKSDSIMSLFNKGRLLEEYAAEELDMPVKQFRKAYKEWLAKKQDKATSPVS